MMKVRFQEGKSVMEIAYEPAINQINKYKKALKEGTFKWEDFNISEVDDSVPLLSWNKELKPSTPSIYRLIDVGLLDNLLPFPFI